MRARLYLILCAVTAVTMAAAATLAKAQDPVKISPGKYRVVFENETVRLLEYRDKPGDVSPMHTHPRHLVYVLSSGKRKFTLPDGKSFVAERKAGEVIWSEAGNHAGENVGTADSHVLIFELKEQRK